MKHAVVARIILLLLVFLVISKAWAQQYTCAFKAPVVKIDFGSGNIQDVNSIDLTKYRRDFSTCPNDGYYSFTSTTSNCFNNDWLTISADHTATRPDGNMMLVNASETGGTFFYTYMYGFPANTTYQLTVWMMNVCRINGGCQPLPPNISIVLTAPNGRKIGLFKTGLLTQGATPLWRKFTGFFQTPPDVTSFSLAMADNTLGGCGNDFALDDITISECTTLKPAINSVKNVPAVITHEPVKQQPPLVKQTPVVKRQASVIKQAPVKIKPVKKDSIVFITKPVTDSKPVTTTPGVTVAPGINLPAPIITRANPVIKEIETEAGEILIDMYDNGDIDGDTVSVYHNNQLIVSRAGLSDKPISFHIKIDKMQPHHELIMVANNLGSIPPNTSMMIITANNKRYEIFISSSEQKNAKVVFDLKE